MNPAQPDRQPDRNPDIINNDNENYQFQVSSTSKNNNGIHSYSHQFTSTLPEVESLSTPVSTPISKLTSNTTSNTASSTTFDTNIGTSINTSTVVNSVPFKSIAPPIKPKLSLRDALYNSPAASNVNYPTPFSNQMVNRHPAGILSPTLTNSLPTRSSGLVPIASQSQNPASLSNSNSYLIKQPPAGILSNSNVKLPVTSAIGVGSTIPQPSFPTLQPKNSLLFPHKLGTTPLSQSISSAIKSESDSSMPFRKKSRKARLASLNEKLSIASGLKEEAQPKASTPKPEPPSSSLGSALTPKVTVESKPSEPKKSVRSNEEIALSKLLSERALQLLAEDQKKATEPDYSSPFESSEDAVSRLLPYHIFQYNPTFLESNRSDLSLIDSRATKLKLTHSALKDRLSVITKRNFQNKNHSSLSTLLDHLLVEDASLNPSRPQSPTKIDRSSAVPTRPSSERPSSVAPSESCP